MSKRRCESIAEMVDEALSIISDEQKCNPEDGAEFFFRGEPSNYHHPGDPHAPLETSFISYLDRDREWVLHERDLYQEALRHNIVSFYDDTTMVERLARMQHYRLPTRFADLSMNMMLATFFAAGGEQVTKSVGSENEDGYVRIIKVSPKKMKSFTSDIITAIAHLPLVNPEDVKPSAEDGLEVLRYEITNERPGFSMNMRQWESSRMQQVEKQLRHEIQHVWAFKPILNNRRIRSQGGLFLAFGCGDDKESLKPSFSPSDYNDENAPSYGIKQVGYVQIHAKAKPEIIKQLRFFGMPEENVYPDLSDVCNSIGERFKQKGKSK